MATNNNVNDPDIDKILIFKQPIYDIAHLVSYINKHSELNLSTKVGIDEDNFELKIDLYTNTVLLNTFNKYDDLIEYLQKVKDRSCNEKDT